MSHVDQKVIFGVVICTLAQKKKKTFEANIYQPIQRYIFESWKECTIGLHNNISLSHDEQKIIFRGIIYTLVKINK